MQKQSLKNVNKQSIRLASIISTALIFCCFLFAGCSHADGNNGNGLWGSDGITMSPGENQITDIISDESNNSGSDNGNADSGSVNGDVDTDSVNGNVDIGSVNGDVDTDSVNEDGDNGINGDGLSESSLSSKPADDDGSITDNQSNNSADKQSDNSADNQTENQSGYQIDNQTDNQIDNQTNNQTDDQNDIEDSLKAEGDSTETYEDSNSSEETETGNSHADTYDGDSTEGTIKLCISEILSSNSKYSKHHSDYYDAIELWNAGDEPVMLSDYCLSDSKKTATDYVLPEVVLEPDGRIVFYCTGSKTKCEYDLPFSLSYFGERVFLSTVEGERVDDVKCPMLPQNVSYGLDDNGEYRIFPGPSLGTKNGSGYERMAESPKVDVAPGFYDGEISVNFIGEGKIRYTLDGTEPNSNSKVWNGKPIKVSSTCAIRAYASVEGCLDSFDAAYSYYISEPDYELDVLMVSMSESDFETMNKNYKSNRKYKANITLLEDGVQKFQINCAINNFGGTSRVYDKKSYEVKFTADYGPTKLKYKLFDNLDINEFDALVLRSGSQDNGGAMMRDEYVSSLSLSTGFVKEVIAQAYRPVNLYINGNYWGVYYIREHIDANMIASHYDCEPEEVTIIKKNADVKCGSASKEWTSLWTYLKSNHLDNTDDYEYVSSLVNLESVADYYIIQLWCGNIDMDNVAVCKIGEDKWRYVLYDLDLSLVRGESGTVEKQLGKFNSGAYTYNALIYRLLENKDFYALFCERFEYILGTIYSDDYALSYLDSMYNMIANDMQYNCMRWNGRDGSNKISYHNYSEWQTHVEKLRAQVAGRADKLRKDFYTNKAR